MEHLSPLAPTRAGSFGSSHLEPLSRTLTIANDGYDYTDAGVAPEDAPTTGQAGGPYKTEPLNGDAKQLMPSRRVPDDTLRLWIRWIDGGWRPKVPDEESTIVDQLPLAAENAHVSDKISSAVCPQKIRNFEIMHNWTQNMDHDESVFLLNVVHRPAGNTEPATGLRRTSIEGHVRWIHSEEATMTPTNFENLFSQYASRHVDSGVKDLTRRLLKRVWATDEREFIGGKFLNPATTRYDGQSKTDDEKPCTFFNFPYFSVEKPRNRATSKARSAGLSLEHPVRTLLQSRYRLEATDDRDPDQSITKLSRAEVKTCVRPPQNHEQENVDNKLKPIIHVPQLWCLSLSGDVMVTSGTISEDALRSSVVMTKDTYVRTPQVGRGPPLIRIILEHSGKQQPFLYPRDQCDWWFGLLNKQRQILRSLGDESNSEVKFGEYKYYTTSKASTESLVDIYNWHDTLMKEKSERLDLWITRTVPGLKITKDAESRETSVEAAMSSPGHRKTDKNVRLETSMTGSSPTMTHTAQLENPSASISAATAESEDTFERVNASHFFSGAAFQPFFEWPFLGDEGKLDGRSPQEKVSLWLRRICGALQDKYSAMIQEEHGRATEPEQVLPSEVPVNLRQKRIRPCSYTDVCARLEQPDTKKSRYITDMRDLHAEAKLLFRLFVPVRSKPVSSRSSGSQSRSIQPYPENTGPKNGAALDATELYWGALDTLIFCLSKYEGRQVDTKELLKGLKRIRSGAEELHLGMCSLRNIHGERHGLQQSGDAEIKLLLEVIVDAFEAVFDVLFGAVKYLWTQAAGPDGSSYNMAGIIGGHVEEVCRLLVAAKARLIVEAGEISHDKGLGPVVTPEAIIILLLERLSRGVYQNVMIDVMDLYEKIVEKIALKVEKSASRRLLLEINRVSEELDIINDVLRQQKSVLTAFRESLDPSTFRTPNIPRRMKFQYEHKSIQKILKAINDSIIDCAELRERASRLAIQNVQLVETQLEDKSKAIIVFTVVTILFLPLSFVTGFFGMNLEGITSSTSTVKHFWVIALPLTFGVVFLCLFAAFLGSIKRWIQRYAKRRKEKNT